jgi:hypothetical protein
MSNQWSRIRAEVKIRKTYIYSHPEQAPSAADVEKVLDGIRFPKSKDEIIPNDNI